MNKTYFDVVVEYLDDDNNTEDFVSLLDNENFNIYEEALKFAENTELKKDYGHCYISVWECDIDGNLLESNIVKCQ